MQSITIFAAILTTLITAIAGAPMPDVASISIAAVVNGLPSCATPVMETMLSRAANFGCDTAANGRPNVVCLCQSKLFKTEAKRGVSKVCPDGKDIGASREWAISRCTAALTAAAHDHAGVVKVATDGSSTTGLKTPQPSLPNGNNTLGTAAGTAVRPASSGNATVALAEAIFDIDDDEDWTAGGGQLRPVASLSFGLAVVVSVVLF